MDLVQSFRKECIQIGSAAQDKAGLLREIAALAVRSPVLAGYPPERIFAALQEREKIGSTGFGNGIAIPHCNLKDVEDFVVGVLILPRGIDFDALDKKQTRILFFIIGPEDRRNQHIQILSSISKLLKTPQTIEDLLGAQTPEKVFETVLARLAPRQQALIFGHAVPMPVAFQPREYGSAGSYKDLVATGQPEATEKNIEDLWE